VLTTAGRWRASSRKINYEAGARLARVAINFAALKIAQKAQWSRQRAEFTDQEIANFSGLNNAALDARRDQRSSGNAELSVLLRAARAGNRSLLTLLNASNALSGAISCIVLAAATEIRDAKQARAAAHAALLHVAAAADNSFWAAHAPDLL
jgi:hypothetical protein